MVRFVPSVAFFTSTGATGTRIVSHRGQMRGGIVDEVVSPFAEWGAEGPRRAMTLGVECFVLRG